MPYTVGTAANAASLKTAIETFCAANGWTLGAGDTLSKGGSHVRLSAYSNDVLRLSAAASADFATEACPQQSQVAISGSQWPVTYYIFLATAPDQVWVTVNYAVEKFQYLAFGDIAKYGTWDGGNFISATHGTATGGEGFKDSVLSMNATGSGGRSSPVQQYTSSAPALFWGQTNSSGWDGSYTAQRTSFLRAKIDGRIWPGAGTVDAWNPSFSQWANPLHLRTPNAFNSQSVLTPFWLWLPRADNYGSLIGHVEHVRSVRITNYNPGDIITIGAEKWKVFPWHKKDTTNPDGYYEATGTLGYAVRYDGP